MFIEFLKGKMPTDFWKKYINPEHDTKYEEAFTEYCEEVGRYFYNIFAHFAFWGVLLTWPVDYYIYGSEPKLLFYINLWRTIVLTIAIVLLILDYFTEITEKHWSNVFFIGLLGIIFAMYYSLSNIGGLEQPWFYSTYCLPILCNVFIHFRLPRRIVFSSGIPAAAVVAYFGSNPHYLDYPFLATPLIILIALIVIGILIGQILHNTFRRSFVQSRRLEASLEEKETLLEEIQHRVKNNLQTICSILKLQSNEQESEETTQILQKSINRVQSMAQIHEQLYQSDNIAKLDFSLYVQKLCDHQMDVHTKSDDVDISLDVKNIELNLDKVITCGLLINELINNSLEHGYARDDEGEITVDFYQLDENKVCLKVSDDGSGFESIYSAGDTTSTGMRIIKSLVEHGLNGNIKFQEKNGVTAKAVFEV